MHIAHGHTEEDIIIPTLEIRGGDYKHVSYILYVCMLRRIRHAKRGDRGDVLVLILGTGANLKGFYANLRCLLDDMSKVVQYAK